MHLQKSNILGAFKLQVQDGELLTLKVAGAGAPQGPTSLHLEPKPKAS